MGHTVGQWRSARVLTGPLRRRSQAVSLSRSWWTADSLKRCQGEGRGFESRRPLQEKALISSDAGRGFFSSRAWLGPSDGTIWDTAQMIPKLR
jgi:hypothetical protein